MYGYGFVARQLAAQRGGVLSGFELPVLHNLLYVLQRFNAIDRVFMLTERNQALDLETVQLSSKPCVVLMGDVLSDSRYLELLLIPSCMIIVFTLFIVILPPVYLDSMVVLFWNMNYQVNIPFIASRCHLVKHFMRQEHRVLLEHGPIFLNGFHNLCCSITLDRWLPFGSIVVSLQSKFRRRQHCLVILQRAVKQWLYRPGACIGQQIVFRLNDVYK